MEQRREGMGESEDLTEEAEKEIRRSFGASYARGLHASARGNAPAYGYSVTITATFGILSVVANSPRVTEIFAFAGGAVVAFALVEAVASGGFKHRLEDEPSQVKALGGSISVLSVGAALSLALTVGLLLGGFVAWPLGSFSATLVYLLAFALEISLAERLKPAPRKKE
jgi:hypothetical protein